MLSRQSAGKLTSDLLLQMLVLVCLEFVVDKIKLQLFEKRGIPVRRVRPEGGSTVLNDDGDDDPA